MESNLEAIVEIIFLLVFLGLLLVPFGLFFIYVFFQNSKRKNIRERAQNSYGQLIGSSRAVPARYASEPRFRSWWKIFPWEGAGLLVPANGVITFVGEHLNGAPLNLQFAPNASQVNWLGKCPWPNGAVSWFVVESQGQKHYFTSETGAFVFGSNNSTKQAFDDCRSSFGLISGSPT